MQQEQLDPTIVNMAKAIKASETGGHKDPYNAQGKSGEFGAYQYTDNTWKNDSKQYLGQEVPLREATVEQQNKVAYYKIKALKDQGLNPLQVASVWNSGDKEAYQGKFSYDTPTHKKGDSSTGYNSSHAYYSVPQYAKSVVQTYEQLKSGVQPNAVITPPNPSSTTGNTPPPDASVSKDANAPKAEPGLLQSLVQNTASPFLQGLSSLRGMGDLIGSTAGQLTGNDSLNKGGVNDYNKGVNEGYDYGYFGKQKPLGTGATPAEGLKNAVGQGINAGLTLSTAVGLKNLLPKLFSSGIKSGTALATEEAQSVISTYAKQTGALAQGTRMSAGEVVNALSEAAQSADPATRPILEQAAKEALVMHLKEAGIKSLSEINQTKATALGLSWKVIKFLVHTAADYGGFKLLGK